MNKYKCVFGEETVVQFGSLHWRQWCWTQHISKMEHYNDGEVNFGPLINLNTKDFCPTVKDTTMAKSPVPVGSSTSHSTGHISDGTVDQVLKAIMALSVGIEKQNSALEDRFGKLSKCLDALESKQRDRHVTLATDHRKSDVPDFFGDPEEECFSALPAPTAPSPYRQLPQREKSRVRPSPYNGSTYTDLVAALDSRFGTSNRTEMFRVSLRSRTLKPEETLPELAQAIRHLTKQGYI